MSLDPGKWRVWSTGYTSTYYGLTEGKTRSEAGGSEINDNKSINSSYQLCNSVPIRTTNWAAGSTFKAGTYEIQWPMWATNAGSTSPTAYAYVTAGSSLFTSDTRSISATLYDVVTFTFTVSSDVINVEYISLALYAKTATGTDTLYFAGCSDNFKMGVQSGASGTSRTAFAATTYAPEVGTHASPTLTADSTPTLTADFTGVYPDDNITLVKYSDTYKTSAHSPSGATTQTIGTASASTSSWPSAYVRRIACTADSTRKCDALNNTYYVVTVKDSSGGAVGTIAYEMLLSAVQAQLLTLNGSGEGSYVTTDDVAPFVEWLDSNVDTTHWRVRVYDTDDVEQWDSTETAAGQTRVQIPSDAGLSPETTYYVVVTLMNGSGGSNWSIDSARGYFQIDASATGVKIISHQGTPDAPALETDSTPTIEWEFERTQSSYNVTIVDESDQSVAYSSGWTSSATQAHTVGSALDAGGTYSVQVQVKDIGQNHVYSSDQRAYIHIQDPTVGTPTLDAEPDTDHLTLVTLSWTAPTVTDGDTLTYEVSLTGSGSGVTQVFSAGEATSLNVGYLPIDTYTWTVRATDEHGMVGSWSSTDEFEVEDGGVVPVCHLVPAAPQVAPLVTSWWYTDQDGDLQSKYQVQLATDSGFSNIIENSGEVTSTALHYEHTTTTAGTYYRRARVYTGAWSEWDSDEVTLVAPTSQTDEVAVYLDAAGTPTALDQTTYPVSGMSVTFRANAPAECQFTINNFDGLEGGIDDDEELLVYLRDSDGKRVTFRGAVVEKEVGDLLTVRAQDIARRFDSWRVTRALSYMSLGQIVAAIVEDPTGSTPTGITAHCEEVNTDEGVVTLATFEGAGKTVSSWLSDLCNATGYFWRIEWLNGGYHFYWYDPSTQPVYSVTLKDSIDRKDNSSSQWRIGDDVRVRKSRAQYANRIIFSGIPDPPPPPGGLTDFDTLFTEAITGWSRFETTYTSGPSIAYTQAWDVARGSHSIFFGWAQTGTGALPRFIPLGYRRMPAQLQDMLNPSFGCLRVRGRITIGGSAPFWNQTWTGDLGCVPADQQSTYLASYWAYIRPHIRPCLYVLTSEAAIAAYDSLELQTIWTDGGSYIADCLPDPKWAGTMEDGTSYRSRGNLVDWTFMLPGGGVQYNAGTADISQWSHVLALGFGVNVDAYAPPIPSIGYGGAKSSDSIVTTDRTVCLQVDDMRIEGVPASSTPLEMSVETAAVTAGTEDPVEAVLGVTGLNTTSARILANLMLDERSRTRQSIENVTLDGIRNIPGRSRLTLNLTSRGIATTTLATYEVRFLPFDAGDKTTVSVGDPSMDVKRALAQLRQKLDGLVGQTL